MNYDFTKEADFELALIQQLSNHGWETECIEYPTEEGACKELGRYYL